MKTRCETVFFFFSFFRDTEGTDSGSMTVFPRFHAVPFSKILTFYRREPFSVQGEYLEGPEAPTLLERHLGDFEIGDIKPQADGSSQKVKVKVRVNLNGVFSVASASLVEKHEVEEEVPMDVDQPKKDKKEGEEKEAGKEGEEAAKPEEKMDSSQDNAEAAAPAADGAAEPVKTEKRKKTVTKNVELPVSARSMGSLLRDKLENLTALEAAFMMQVCGFASLHFEFETTY